MSSPPRSDPSIAPRTWQRLDFRHLTPTARPALGLGAWTPPSPLGNSCGHPRPPPPPGPPAGTPEGHPGRQRPPLRKVISRKAERFEEGGPDGPRPLGGPGGASAPIGPPGRPRSAHWPARPSLGAPGPPPVPTLARAPEPEAASLERGGERGNAGGGAEGGRRAGRARRQVGGWAGAGPGGGPAGSVSPPPLLVLRSPNPKSRR